MERSLISETPNLIGKEVKLNGWVHIRRDHGKIIFIDLRDRSGFIQTVIIPDHKEAYEVAKKIRSEFIIEMEGLVKERPESAVNKDSSTGKVEFEAKKIKIISEPKEDFPVDISEEDMKINLETLLNNRVVTLRNDKVKSIFKISAEIISAYKEFLGNDGFQEIKTSKIMSSATEGGANFFKIKYFDNDAFLAQSPQFYKQAGVGAFERVFEIGPVFRAEPHFTSRHVNEYVSLDAEMGFIENFEDVMKELEKCIAFIFSHIKKNCAEDLKKYEAEVPEVKVIPRVKLTEALEILEKEYGKKTETVDIDPEGEKLISEWVKKKYDSDLVFLTHYPSSIRPFYTMPSKDPQYTEGFDLIFRGVEIVTGGQRIHDYDQLVENIKKHKLDPKDFKHYLEIFKYGMPPHGGWGMGLERVVQKILGLKNIKEAVMFPRDVKRLAP